MTAPLTDAEFDALIEAGHAVLQAFPRVAGACVMMSALFVGRLHAMGHHRAALVGGSLAIGTQLTFGGTVPNLDFAATDLDWDGHAWVRFGEYLADVSLVQTAWDERAPQALARHVRNLRRATQRLYIATPGGAARDGLVYTPQHLFSAEQIDRLYRGALTMLPDPSK